MRGNALIAEWGWWDFFLAQRRRQQRKLGPLPIYSICAFRVQDPPSGIRVPNPYHVHVPDLLARAVNCKTSPITPNQKIGQIGVLRFLTAPETHQLLWLYNVYGYSSNPGLDSQGKKGRVYN
jgi:hypothetical protein